MKKRIVSFAIALSLCFSLSSVAFAVSQNNPFTDVAETDYYYEAVMWALENNVTSGTSATTFSPMSTCTRGQVVTFLWRAAGSPEPKAAVNPFNDVSTSDYYSKSVLWAVEQGITSGTSATTFSPSNTCTNAQVITFLWRAEGSPSASGNSALANSYGNSYYTNAVAWADTCGVLAGTSAEFSADSACPRSNIVSYLYAVFNDSNAPAGDVESIPATSIRLSQSSATLKVGDTLQLNAIVSPENANTNNTVKWSCTDRSAKPTDVVTVSPTGLVTALREGIATVWAELPDWTMDMCTINVSESTVEITLRNSLPQKAGMFMPNGSLLSEFEITDFKYDVQRSFDGTYRATIYFSGRKTYDSTGDSRRSACFIHWQLLTMSGELVQSGSVTTDTIKSGENFANAHEPIYNLQPGNYVLEISYS